MSSVPGASSSHDSVLQNQYGLGGLPASGRTVLPGDIVVDPDEPLSMDASRSHPDAAAAPHSASVVCGSGITQLNSYAAATTTGAVQEFEHKRYVPAPEDEVIGIVLERHALEYLVDIGSAVPAKLDSLAFEGATKRNRPNLKVHTPVYCRVALANRDMAPEVVCVTPQGVIDRVVRLTGECSSGKATHFGPLSGGTIIRVPLGYARRLLSNACPVLRELGAHVAFETAIGANGLVWIHSESSAQTVIISNAIKSAEHLNDGDVKELVKALVKRIRQG